MRDINRQILSGFVNSKPRNIPDNRGKADGILLFIDSKSSRESDKYEQWSAIFWDKQAEIFRNFVDIIQNKRITVIGKSIRNVKKKTDSAGQEYYQYYSQIRVTDFCLGSVDLWKNPHAGEIFKFKEQNVDINSILKDMIKDDDIDLEDDNDIKINTGDDKDGTN